MADREKVIKGLEICIRMQDNEKCPDECPYRKDICYGTVGLMADALSLLQAQEPIKPKVNIDTWVCGNCGTRVEHESMIGPNAVLAETFKFCPACGKKVDWDGL